MHNLTLNRLIALNKVIDAFSTTVSITEDLSSSNKTSMREKRNNNTLDQSHRDVCEGRPQR